MQRNKLEGVKLNSTRKLKTLPGNLHTDMKVELKRQSSPATSQVSVKSDRSMDLPGNFLGGTIQDMSRSILSRGVSPAPSHVSMKSDRSMDLPGNFLGGITKDMTRFPFQTPAPTHMSLKSESSMDLPENGITSVMTSDLSSTLLMEDHVRCLVCKNVLKEPVSIPCGHSYCRQCISSYWAQPNHAGLYACPQCSHTYSSCPALNTNTALAEVVHKLQHFSHVPPSQCCAAPGDVACDFCTGRKLRAVKSCLTCMASFCEPHGRQHYTVPALQRHTLVGICQKHHRVLDMCGTDQIYVCSLCTVDEHHNYAIRGINLNQVRHCEREPEDLHVNIGEKTCDLGPIVKDTQMKKLTVDIANVTKMKEESAEEMGKNRLKIQHIEQKGEQNGEIYKKSSNMKEESTQLVGKIAKLKTENSKNSDQKTELQRECIGLLTQKTELKTTISKLRKRNSWLRHCNSELITDNIELSNEREKLETENFNLRHRNTYLMEETYRLREEENTELSQVPGLKEEIAMLKSHISKLNKKCTMLKRHLNSVIIGRPGLPANVTLDPDTSHCQFTISDDGKRMKFGRDDYKSILDNRQRFDWLSFVVAKEGFTSGRHFWQVEVSKSWIIGVTKESACRKGLFTAKAENGYWCLHCSSHLLHLLESDSTTDPVPVGYAPVELRLIFVCLDVNERWVSFHDGESWKHLHTFRDMVFSHGERIYPVFCCKNLDEEVGIKAI